MKKRFIYSFLLAGAALATSCTKNFDAVNTNPNKTTADIFNPNYLMSQSQLDFSQTGYDDLLFQSLWVQGLASTGSYYGNGDKYVYRNSAQGYFSRTWNTDYGALSKVDEIKNLVRGNSAYSNLDACATILRVLYIQRITDLYGDAPYSQEGQAKAGITQPVFDKQQAIYTAMLTQLDGAATALNVSGDKPSADLFYAGDIVKWKKLAYSLMLRAAMRLTKVDPATAKTYAEKAYAGGTMTSINDNAFVRADAANSNSNFNANAYLVPEDFTTLKWSKTVVDYMKANNDPRLSAVAEIAGGSTVGASESQVSGNNSATLAVGLPNGFDTDGGATDVTKAPGYPGTASASSSITEKLSRYSRPRFAVYGDRNQANILVTYGETELLLAEASIRGWNTGSAATHFANALTANMQTLAQINTSGAASVNSTDIATYVNAHPLVTATALQQINMEYFVVTSTLWDFNETYANWRRSGYPVLTPVTYPGQYITGSIPRRMPYPITLAQTNGANYQAAVASMGGDTFTTRVWWDKQ